MSNASSPNSPSDLGVLAYRRSPGLEIAAARWLLAWMIINLIFGIPLVGVVGFCVVLFFLNPQDPWIGLILIEAVVIAIPATLLLIWARQCFLCRRGILQGDALSAARAITLSWVVFAACFILALGTIFGMIAVLKEGTSGPLVNLTVLLAWLTALVVTVALTIRSLRKTEQALHRSVSPP